MKILITLGLAGALSWNPTLQDIGETRQAVPTIYPIAQHVDVSDYKCRIGVRYGYGWLIGQEVFFLSESKIYGPFLVTDVESIRHFPFMRDNELAADIDCPEFVHKKGQFLLQWHR